MNGFELGLIPADEKNKPGINGTVVYWGVDDIDTAWNHLLEYGAKSYEEINGVGDGIKVATLIDPFGNSLGIIENSHFKMT